jgi:hypothetical protein
MTRVHRMRRRGRAPGAAVCAMLALLLAMSLSSCSSSGTAAPATSTSSASDIPALPRALVQSHLLSASKLGTGWKNSPFQAPYGGLPCQSEGSKTIAQSTLAVFDIGMSAKSDNPAASVVEEVLGYRDQASAKAGLVAVQSGLDCVTGHAYHPNEGPTTVLIGAQVDATKATGASTAYSWEFDTFSQKSQQYAILAKTVVILVRVGLYYKQPKSLKPLPDSDAIAKQAYTLINTS